MLKLSIMAEIRRVGLQPGNSVLEERKDAQRQLSQEQNARVKEDEILAHHLSQQKEAEKANKKMNAEDPALPVISPSP
ncbi:ankyrin repeat domain-containing protein 26-like isoform X3 [Vicugna pacos]|uniref:Ankyrin repeat domain-containing protein 26-like isoform X3 n=1 Tax=Vicugna pacos TaxID=30538 RepID=A0ABM5BQR3_VICPA